MKITVFGSSHGNPEKGRFQTSVLLQSGGKNYLIDAAEPVGALLVNHGLQAAQISAAFITHMHIDHTGGLPALLEQAGKHRHLFPEISMSLFLPDPQAVPALSAWCDINRAKWRNGTEIYDLNEKTCFSDGTVKVGFIPTGHLPGGADGTARSYAVQISCEGKKVLFSGDLQADFGDFPVKKAEECDLIFCELTHFQLDKALPVLKMLTPEKLVFYHLHTPYQTPSGAMEVQKKCAILNYPVLLAGDGDVIEV